MVKTFNREINGRSETQFSAAFSQQTGVGSYLAMESFDGTVAGLTGTFNFAHSATTTGSDRSGEFIIVPGSGSGELTGIVGSGSIEMDERGGHRLNLEWELAIEPNS